MTSRALAEFGYARRRALRLCEVATDVRLRPLTYEDIEPPLHAALAAYVSGWEAYIEAVTREFLQLQVARADPLASAFAKILGDEAGRAIKRFNTPTFEESRGLILRFTGFDPFTILRSERLKMTSDQSRGRLDEVLKVRHAFAHGLPLPSFPWLTRYNREARLSRQSLKMVDILISDLSKAIDVGLSQYARNILKSAVW